MNTLRSLADTLAQLADAASQPAPAAFLRTTSMELSVPLDLALEQRGGELVLLADLPRFVYRTAFDPAPARLRVRWAEGVAP